MEGCIVNLYNCREILCVAGGDIGGKLMDGLLKNKAETIFNINQNANRKKFIGVINPEYFRPFYRLYNYTFNVEEQIKRLTILTDYMRQFANLPVIAFGHEYLCLSSLIQFEERLNRIQETTPFTDLHQLSCLFIGATSQTYKYLQIIKQIAETFDIPIIMAVDYKKHDWEYLNQPKIEDVRNRRAYMKYATNFLLAYQFPYVDAKLECGKKYTYIDYPIKNIDEIVSRPIVLHYEKSRFIQSIPFKNLVSK